MHGSSSWGKPPDARGLANAALSPLASPFGRRPDCRRSYVANAALTPHGWLLYLKLKTALAPHEQAV
ncbi:MAG: hypothetical protein V7K40_26070 [Nostoc sp.]